MSAQVGDVAVVRGQLARVLTINEGHREITFEYVGEHHCPTCGRPPRISINEGCPNWESWVKPVSTCGGSR